MKIDLHCHSVYSHDNHLEPDALIRRAFDLGLDGVCFTEHNSMEASLPIDGMKRSNDVLLLRGVEVSTDAGHLLVYGVEDDSWNRWGRNNYLDLTKVVQAVHTLGGICIPAHPFRGWESMGDQVFTFTGFDAIETHNGVNGPKQNNPAIEAAKKLGLPSVGGSDCHYVNQVGQAFTEFKNPIASMEDLIREIKDGNCQGRLL